MALLLSPDSRPPPEPISHLPEASKELDVPRCTIYSLSEEIRPEPAQKRKQDSLDPFECPQGGLRGTEPATSTPKLPTLSSHEDLARGRHCEALQADLRRAAEYVDALLVFSELLAQRSELQAPPPLEHVLRALRAHQDGVIRWLWHLQAKLVRHSLVFEEANKPDQDLEAEGDSDCAGPGGVWGPWVPSGLSTPAELEWDPAGDVGGLEPLGQKAAGTPGIPCELCGHRGPWGTGQDLKEKKRQASPHPQDVMLEVDPRASAPVSRWPLTFLFLLLFFLLVGITLLLPMSGGFCFSHTRLARTPNLVLSYVNGPPPI
ncbi:nesprin-4 [Rhynchocyon petersi]